MLKYDYTSAVAESPPFGPVLMKDMQGKQKTYRLQFTILHRSSHSRPTRSTSNFMVLVINSLHICTKTSHCDHRSRISSLDI